VGVSWVKRFHVTSSVAELAGFRVFDANTGIYVAGA